MTTVAPALAEITGTYTIDPTHTRIGIVSRYAMVTKVRGAFNEFEGAAVLDGADPSRSTASVTIQAASIDTRNAQRDEHLRNNDFLATDEFPTITFVSVTIPFSYEGGATDPFGNVRVGSRAASRSAARTSASPGTPRCRPVACSWATRSCSSSRSRRSGTPATDPETTRGRRDPDPGLAS